MKYLLVADIAKKWNISERSVRNYCAQGRVNGAFLTGKTWNIPENAEKPERINKKKEEAITLLDILKEQKNSKYTGGIYHKTQIDLTYNSNHMEGSRLTHDQTRYIPPGIPASFSIFNLVKRSFAIFSARFFLTGFTASSGILHVFPSRITPGIFPWAQ